MNVSMGQVVSHEKYILLILPCIEQLIGSGLRKEYYRAVCCHPICLTLCRAHYEVLASGQIHTWKGKKKKKEIL